MSQTAYNLTMPKAFAGMKGDSRFDLVESAVAFLAVAFGRAVAAKPTEKDVHVAVRDISTLTFSGDFVSLNVINLTVNGTPIAPVTFATDHATTATALLAAINLLPGVVATKSTNGRVYTITTKGVVITTSAVVTAGVGQVTASADYVTPQNDIFRGISIHRNVELGVVVAGQAFYRAGEVVDVLRRGLVWIEAGVAVNADEVAYVDMAGGLGKFTNVSTNNLVTGGYFRSSVAVAGLAQIEINLP